MNRTITSAGVCVMLAMGASAQAQVGLLLVAPEALDLAQA